MSTHLKEATISALYTLWWALHVEEADHYDRYRRAVHAEESDTTDLDRVFMDTYMNKNKAEACLGRFGVTGDTVIASRVIATGPEMVSLRPSKTRKRIHACHACGAQIHVGVKFWTSDAHHHRFCGACVAGPIILVAGGLLP